MKDTKLNNLLGMDQYSEKDIFKSNKTTKRTEVAKDVIQENAYVLGKDVLGGSLKNKETHAARGLHNLICLDDFTKSVPSTSSKSTKRTDVAKDVLLEKKKAKAKKEEDCADCEKEKKGKKGDCVSAKQAKLPWNKDKKIC